MFGQEDRAVTERDQEILAEVRDRLYDWSPLRESGAPIGIEVDNGVVTLRGWVMSRSQKRAAERLASEVPGVTEVRNELFSDDELILAVAAALAADERTAHDFPGVHIGAYMGRITLTGHVASQEESEIAEDVAARVPGVRSVDNRLVVQAVAMAAAA